MKLRNENLEFLTSKERIDLIDDIISNPDLTVTEEEAQEALSELVYGGQLKFNQGIFNTTNYEMPNAKARFSKTAVKLNLWKQLKMKVCPLIDEDTEQNKIAEIVVDAVGELIPYGIIVKRLLKKVVSYFLKIGHSVVCNDIEVEAASTALAGKEKINFYENEPEFIREAVRIANAVLANEEFYKKIADKKEFDESDITGKVLGNLIKLSTIEAQVEPYRSAWPWSNANAYTTPKKPNRICLNSRKFDNITSAKKWAVTIIHEFVHLVDFENSDYDFGHGSNRRKNKENTAPYWVEEVAKEIINQEIQ